ncbi:MAG: 3'-5' exoribonuclease YhaM family protein [Terriglobia bacterium]
MKDVFVRDLKAGCQVDCSFLLLNKERKIARNGSAYLDLEFGDSTGSLRGKLWDCDRLKFEAGVDEIVMVAGTVEDYQGVRQIAVRAIRKAPADGVSLLDYLPRTRHDPEQMYTALIERVGQIAEDPLRQLLLAVMQDPVIAPRYKLAPAAMSLHHAFLGGLLEHVSSLCQLADSLCDHYPQLDRSLLITGVVLHDVGKVEELSFDGSFRYSTRGRLLGHIAIGLELVREKMRSIPEFPQPLKDRIEHLILSHHGKLEFGSPKEPLFPEALALHLLDELDSKLESMRAQYAADHERAGEWTSRNRSLGRELLKSPAGNA